MTGIRPLRWYAGLFFGAAVLFTPQFASAELVAYAGQANQFSIPPLQAWGGSLGMDFTVNAPISVDAVGVYNAAGNGMVNGTLQVAIFNNDGSGSIVAGTAVTFTPGTYMQDLVNDGPFDVYQAISAVILNPGNYTAVAVGFSSADPNGNTGFQGGVGAVEDSSGLLTYTGSARFDADQTGLLIFPETTDTGPANRYDAGTFEFSSAAPEPGTFGLAISAAIALIQVRKRLTARQDRGQNFRRAA